MGKFQKEKKQMPAFLVKTGQVFSGIGHVFKLIGSYILRMHKIIMAVPVMLAAVGLAMKAQSVLPEQVGFDLQPDGQYAQFLSRDLAVLGPLALTMVCLILMLLSRRTVYPWLISIFTLALPVFIMLTAGLFG